MVFSSLIFLFLFLPACLILYFLAPGLKVKNIVLLVFSLVFYAWGEPFYVLLLIASAAMNYGAGRWMGTRRAKGRSLKPILVGAVALNLLALGVFKYAGLLVSTFNQLTGLGLAVPNIALPIGISFYTFQAMSYVVDVYRDQVGVQKSYLKFLLYISLFPQLIAGPIVRYSDVDAQLEDRHATREDMFYGLIRFATGLGKKILIADHCFSVASQMLDGPLQTATTAGTWLGILMFTFQIYFDFSGYSDMAVGLGRMLGFEFLPNFDHPYISRSITEFWRRWHISLSTWFKEYLYIPLGGNRCSKGRWVFNLFVVWAATGIWHGASWNYVIWGLYFFVLLLMEKLWLGRLLSQLPKVVQHVYTLFFVLVSWAIFALEDFGQLGAYLKVMFGMGGAPLLDSAFGYYLASYLPILCVAAVASTNAGASLYHKLPRAAAQAACAVLVVIGLVVCSGYMVDGTYNPFLYFRF